MNASSSLPTPGAVSANGQLDILRTLAPVRWSLGVANVARTTLFGSGAGAGIGAAILLVDRVRAFQIAVPGAWLAVVLGFVVGAAIGLMRWPGALQAARAADLFFHLDDRLTTALELRSTDSAVARAQSRDAARFIEGLALSRCRGRWFQRREAALVGAAAVVFAGALTIAPPNVRHRAAVAPADTVQTRRAAANQVRKLTSALHLGLTPAQLHSPAMRRLDLALSRLRRQLLQAATPRANLRAVSATQQQLRQIARGLHPVNGRAVAQLNGSLSRYLGTNQTRGSGTARNRSDLATAQALSRLAQSLSHLTPAQRAALAQALAKAANATSNNSLRSALRQAASSLANADSQAATSALQQTAQMLSQSASARAALSRLAAAGQQLGGIKNQIAGTGAAPPSPSSSAAQGRSNAGNGPQRAGGKSGTAPGSARAGMTGRGTRPGQGRGRGQGVGRGQGRGTGRGQGQGTGQGRAASQGRGTSGAHGTGGRGRSSLSKKGRTTMVYVPGKQGNGAEIVRNGPKGAPAPGALVPYQQVVGQYAQRAHQALDRTALPPSLQGYVRRYFSTLSQ